MFGRTFNHGTTRKYVIYFGTLFNNIFLTRDDETDAQIQKMKVPLHYGPKEKFLARAEGNPNLDREVAITLPRMAFQIVNYSYDAERALNSIGKVRSTSATVPTKASFQYNPVPYNLEFELYIMVKNAEDGTRIVEQILPYFVPEYTSTLNINPDLGITYDIPLSINAISQEDTYEGQFQVRRALIWTLSFTMKAWLFGPTRESSIINQVELNTKVISTGDIEDATAANPNAIELVITPGLTINGEPTNNPALTIDKNLIKSSDNYGFITEYTENL